MIRSKIFTVASFTLFIFSHQTSVTMEFCKNIASEMVTKPAAKVFATTAGTALGYGIAHNLITSAITSKNTQNSIETALNSFLNTLGPTLLCGVSLAAVTRVGSWPQLEASNLISPFALACAGISLMSAFEGVKGYYAYDEIAKEDPDYIKSQMDKGFSPRQIKWATATVKAQKAARDFSLFAACLALPAYLLYKRYSLS